MQTARDTIGDVEKKLPEAQSLELEGDEWGMGASTESLRNGMLNVGALVPPRGRAET